MKHLPEFEGEKPRGLWMSLSGTITHETSQPPDAFHLGDELVLVVRCDVVGVKHTRKTDGKDGPRVLIRQHIVSASEAHLVSYEVLRDARIGTDERRLALSGEGRLDFTVLEPEGPNPYEGAPADLEVLALGAGDGEIIDAEIVEDVEIVDRETGEIVATVTPLTPKQREAVQFLHRHHRADVDVRESNITECTVASHLTGQACALYWMHARNLADKGLAETTAREGSIFVVLTAAGLTQAALIGDD